ncbi:Putative trans-acting enoyl reductase [Psilocybe cubensis]|uniref:Trans-acting enoyl reductase n=2 Tax=Psilocybe cubensis TaxID=181762 RepID=A0ACB8HCJ5_PSICU|nr:Putative trans-acting enoyl reductase [Psilocybe cubensis]KAH9485646.1 Putative trans-acting enoyl reductase [Psilocybe cubensis]
MNEKTDILLLGATGYTGGLITRYLSVHPQRAHFSLALGARSADKLKKFAQELGLSGSVKFVQVDVTKEDEVEAAVKSTRVVINTVGPYWLWGTPVVRSCVRNGVHYVDLTGETTFIRRIITEFDYFATKTGSIIVPACGFDSIPSDITAYLANKTLKSLGPTPTGEYLAAGESTSAVMTVGGVSGGTVASMMVALEAVPKNETKESMLPYSISPFIGLKTQPFRFLYNLVIPGSKTLTGGHWVMAASNKAIVERSFGLLEIQNLTAKNKDSQIARYGPQFSYHEFMVTSGAVSAIVLTATLLIGFGLLLVKPIRHVAKAFLPKSGDGPTDEDMQKGFLKMTNITTSTSSPSLKVETVIKGKGDPGYLLTAIMISESALCFLLPPVSESSKIQPGKIGNIHSLPPLAQKGGVLTPVTAFGDVLIQRLEESGRFEFSSSVVNDAIHKKDA